MQSKDLQIDWLRTFLAIVDSGSITAASRLISRSQSAESMQFKKLEDSVFCISMGARRMGMSSSWGMLGKRNTERR